MEALVVHCMSSVRKSITTFGGHPKWVFMMFHIHRWKQFPYHMEYLCLKSDENSASMMRSSHLISDTNMPQIRHRGHTVHRFTATRKPVWGAPEVNLKHRVIPNDKHQLMRLSSLIKLHSSFNTILNNYVPCRWHYIICNHYHHHVHHHRQQQITVDVG